MSSPEVSQNEAKDDEIRIELVSSADDLVQAFQTLGSAFGKQTHDSIWIALNPGWDTRQGIEAGSARLLSRWESVTKNRDGKPNTLFVKATLPNPQSEGKDRVFAGFAIWQQTSFVEGHGDAPTDSLGDLEALHPGNEIEQRFATQVWSSLVKERIAYVREKATSTSGLPAVFALDVCAVDPALQRRGIAGKLVQFGLDEAKRRGLEATTEASIMGRPVYQRLGFRAFGDEIVFELDEEFKRRDKPPTNIFLRTGNSE